MVAILNDSGISFLSSFLKEKVIKTQYFLIVKNKKMGETVNAKLQSIQFTKKLVHNFSLKEIKLSTMIRF